MNLRTFTGRVVGTNPRELRDAFECAGLFEKVRGTGDDLQLRLAAHLAERLFVQIDHHVIVTADDEQRRRLHPRQDIAREIGPAAAGDDCGDPIGTLAAAASAAPPPVLEPK